jgi:short-subunit dehydrogenase
VIPVMRKQGAGTILDVSSAMTFLTIPRSGAHAASKAGLENCSMIARAELAEAGVTFLLTFSSVAATEFVRVSPRRRRGRRRPIGVRPGGDREAPSDDADAFLAPDRKQRRASRPDARGVGATRSRPDMP